jgi:hypothetical protein
MFYSFSNLQGIDRCVPFLAYHVPFFTKKYGKLLRFSGQGVEKINDDIKKMIHSKTNKWNATVDALQVRPIFLQFLSNLGYGKVVDITRHRVILRIFVSYE